MENEASQWLEVNRRQRLNADPPVGAEADVNEQPNRPPGESGETAGATSSVARILGFIARHPSGVVQSVLLLLVAIIILQNVESTSIDVLFWSVPALPKLVLIFVSMLVGAVAWELIRRWLRR